jgi:hypothetical protein
MAYTQFNGWNIIPMPAKPAPRQIDFGMSDSIGETVSPFTRQSQVQQWMGADWWTLNVSMPSMKRPWASEWIAWLAELRGKYNVFQVGDPSGAKPQGVPQGIPVVDCADSAAYNLPGTTTLYTRGWKPNTQRLLLPCDYLQIGYRLHIVSGLSTVNSDANGKANFSIWPSIRELPTDGEPIILHNTTGLFRLASNTRNWTANYLKVIPIAFKCKEAR